MDGRDELQNKADAWAIAFPAIIFFLEAGVLTTGARKDLERAIKIAAGETGEVDES